MEIQGSDLDIAMVRLGTLAFFKTDPLERAAIRLEIGEMCPNPEALEWMVDTALVELKSWAGLAGLREILSRRCRPADRREVDPDGEARYLELEAVRTDQKLQAWRAEAKAIEGKVVKQIEGTTSCISPSMEAPKQEASKPRPEPPVLELGPKRSPEQNELIMEQLKERLAQRMVMAGMDGEK